MASTDAHPIPFKNVAYRVTFPILDADGDLVMGATGLDSEVSLDGGTFADCTSEATEIATNSGMYFLDLTQAEMNADTVAIIVKTTSSGAKTTPIVLYPQEADDIRVAVTHWVATAVATVDTAGYPKVTVKSGTGTGEINLASGVADANATKIAGATVSTTTAQLGVNVVQAGATAWGSGAITAASIAADAITAAKIADGAIDAATFAAGAINAAAIASAALTAAKFAANAIDAGALATDAVTEIQAGLATAASIAALNNLSAAQVLTQAASALTSYGAAKPADIPAANAVADALLDRASAVDTYTPRQILRGLLAALGGDITFAGNIASVTAGDKSKTRITSETNAQEERLNVVLDLS